MFLSHHIINTSKSPWDCTVCSLDTKPETSHQQAVRALVRPDQWRCSHCGLLSNQSCENADGLGLGGLAPQNRRIRSNPCTSVSVGWSQHPVASLSGEGEAAAAAAADFSQISPPISRARRCPNTETGGEK